jgi:cytochrome c oxidase assembly protein Cox11
MSKLYIPVAVTTLALAWAEMPLQALICAGLGASLIEAIKWAYRAQKQGGQNDL